MSAHQFSNRGIGALLGQALDKLETRYGPQKPVWPTHPYMFLLWWHCGYPATDASCSKGWAALKRSVGLKPDRILAATSEKLTEAMKAGGIVPDVRAERLKEIADRVIEQFEGDFVTTLRDLPVPKARSALKKFPGIADPGADRILLFGGVSPVAAVPSSLPQVAVRLLRGSVPASYSRTYSEAQRIIVEGVPETFAARTRAYLLLKRHGEELCKRTAPKCTICPLSDSCAYLNAKNFSDRAR